MLTSKNHNIRIDLMHARSLRIILAGYEYMLSILHEKTIHERSINVLLTDVYINIQTISPRIQ